MPKSQKNDDAHTPPSSQLVLLMFATVADTSARLFIPTVGGTILGIWLDHKYATTPILTILGVTLGTALAFVLVYLQIRKVKN